MIDDFNPYYLLWSTVIEFQRSERPWARDASVAGHLPNPSSTRISRYCCWLLSSHPCTKGSCEKGYAPRSSPPFELCQTYVLSSVTGSGHWSRSRPTTLQRWRTPLTAGTSVPDARRNQKTFQIWRQLWLSNNFHQGPCGFHEHLQEQLVRIYFA